MLQIEIDEVKVRIVELAHKAANGEPFIISDAGKPLAKVLGYEKNGASKRLKLFGCMRGQGHIAKELDFKTFCREEIDELFGLDASAQ